MKRISALVAASALLLAACGRVSQSAGVGADPTSSDVPAESEGLAPDDTAASTGDAMPIFLPWDGDIPIWSLPLQESATLIVGKMSNDQEVLDLLPPGCGGTGGDTPVPSFENCLGRLLSERGVSDAALRFYRRFDLSVFSIRGAGPVKVLRAVEWESYGSTGGPLRDLIATPDGLLETLNGWQPFLDANAAAEATELARAIEKVDDSASFGPWLYIGTPEQTDAGWTVSIVACLVSYYNCGYTWGLNATFALDFTPEGALQGARFVDTCGTRELRDRVANSQRVNEAGDILTVDPALLDGLSECPDYETPYPQTVPAP